MLKGTLCGVVCIFHQLTLDRFFAEIINYATLYTTVKTGEQETA